MKILLYGINFAPELTGIGKYTGEMAAWLAARGHQVRVITAPPYYPAWQVSPGYSASRYTTEQWQGVTVMRTPLWVPARPGGAKRLLHLASFALGSLPVLLRQWFWRPNVVWVVEPPLFCAPAAAMLARLAGGKAWLHIQDYEVDAAFDLGLLKGAALRRCVVAAEGWLMRRFHRVSTISGRMLGRAQAKGVDAARLVSFPNWVDISAIQPLRGPSPYRAELGIAADAVVALYSGNMGGKQGLEVLAEAARLLTDQPQVQFVLCGGGAGRADLVQRCLGLPNVRFLDLQPVERLSDLLGLADIHLLPQRADAADLVMPSKLTGMLASGRAVVATAHPHTELGRVVAQHCGVVVPPEDAAALAGAIRTLAADAPRRAQLGRSARAYALAELDRDAVLARFEAQLLACVGQGAGTAIAG
ncbi:D-inositol-3-phosphate glycosyltransferase [Comamonadaceae bacterium OS-1]|nr:D-inositol-3-phosphate glycosyltransferase [Comamonadaceae bacterium OS-1]